jgi:hypothetical protein
MIAKQDVSKMTPAQINNMVRSKLKNVRSIHEFYELHGKNLSAILTFSITY